MTEVTPDLHDEDGEEEVADIVVLAMLVRQFYRKYVAFHSDHDVAQAGCLTLYTFYTYVYDEFPFAPILLITKPTSEAGASRLMDVAELLARQPYVVVDPSGPAMRNVIELLRPTLIVDEIDLLRKSPDLRTIFNAGVEKGRQIIRAGRNGAVYEYDPFGPKILGGIYGEEPPLKGATLSRCIQIALRRRHEGKADEQIAEFFKDDAEAQCQRIVRALRQWAQWTDRRALAAARPELPAQLTDRQRDAWRPLVVIGDMIGESWGQAARQWAVELSEAIPMTPDPMIQLLKDCYRVLVSPGHADDRAIASAILASERNALPDREYDQEVNALRLGKLLARFHIKPERPTIGGTQVRGYVIRNDHGEFVPVWADAIGRYRLGKSPSLSV